MYDEEEMRTEAIRQLRRHTKLLYNLVNDYCYRNMRIRDESWGEREVSEFEAASGDWG